VELLNLNPLVHLCIVRSSVTRLSVDQKQVLAQRYVEDERQRVQSALSCESTADTTSSSNNDDVNNDDNDATPQQLSDQLPVDEKDLLDDVQSPVSSTEDNDEHSATTDSSGSWQTILHISFFIVIDAMDRARWRKLIGMIDDYDESSGWMFLLVPAHPGFPGQIPQSRKTVVLCVCVVHTHTPTQPIYGHLGFCPRLPGWAGTRKVKPGR